MALQMFLCFFSLLLFISWKVTPISPREMLSPDESVPSIEDTELGIVGGKQTGKGQYPYMVSILRKSRSKGMKHNCGGTILNSMTILTAAHCLNKNKAHFVYVGHTSIATFEKEYIFKVAKITYHKRFNNRKLRNGYDIGVIKLDRKISFTRLKDVAKICIPARGVKADMRKCRVMGWGVNANNDAPKNMFVAKAPMVKRDKDCLRTRKIICAGYSGGPGACKGDSGGALVRYRCCKIYQNGYIEKHSRYVQRHPSRIQFSNLALSASS